MSARKQTDPGDAGRPRVTLTDLRARKSAGEKFPVLTSYDATTARWQVEAGVDVLLVGDSIGMCVFGHESTVRVKLSEMLSACGAVRRGAPSAYVIGDMPFGSYHNRLNEAVDHALAFVADGGCDCVKLECDGRMADVVAAMDRANVPTMAHLGLLPQRITYTGSYKATGRTAEDAERLVADAIKLVDAGAVMLLLEAVPAETTQRVTDAVGVPVVGCGAGPSCDGFVVVTNDLLGLTPGRTPRFVPKLADLGPQMRDAFAKYRQDIAAGAYPAPEHLYPMRKD
ncbi:MAG: 3-methyl-2-oxobutanoate hydroxymethyltransferase [Phycisphaerae bacterium]|nr:3-methyl-2-oxobutanoate hydroxymethyltransferase [Phycisphaerae bacterium]